MDLMFNLNADGLSEKLLEFLRSQTSVVVSNGSQHMQDGSSVATALINVSFQALKEAHSVNIGALRTTSQEGKAS